MEENTTLFTVTSDSNITTDLLGNDKNLLDMESFDPLEPSSKIVSDTHNDNSPGRDLLDEISGNSQSGLVSTTRPLSTREDIKADDRSISPSIPTSNISEFEIDKKSPIDNIADTRVEDSFRDQTPELMQRSNDDRLLIDQEDTHHTVERELFSSSIQPGSDSPISFDKVLESETEEKEPLPKVKDPKIGSQAKELDNYEFETCAYETAAQPAVKREVAMEAETVGNAKNCESECPFSAGAWFNPEKLHPVVAEYVYWHDPKKSGIAFGASLILLLSLKFFSLISVIAYITLALLSVTVSFRIYKNVLQAVQKSNEGHPFKEYLEMDIALSQDKVGETVEVMIHHVNCVTGKLRSLVLVEDLFDTLKLVALAWCMTYVGAWFNGLTLIILALVSAFTLPKVYETNKTQIDMYAELVRTKSKEVIDMVNAKMPLGKKKKDQ